jgi:hypothetical protein
MPTDNERREVARRLRAAAKKLGPNMDAHEFAHYTADVLDVDESMTWYEMELRLADLIEPIEPEVKYVAEVKVDGWRLEELAHDAAVELTGIYRDALLELADGLEKDADNIISAARNAQFTGSGPRMEEAKHDAYDWRQIAARIREALGVADK